MQGYRAKNWFQFRQQVIELDDKACVRCGKSLANGAKLQVHHKRYIAGRKPWEYDFEDCETLCQGCHAAEHGKIRPSTGWTFHGMGDLGGRDGHCDCCGTSIRYVFTVHHESWGTLDVGTVCCDALTGETSAQDERRALQSYKGKKKRFIASKKWMRFANMDQLEHKRIRVQIIREHTEYLLRLNGVRGKLRFKTIDDAKSTVFDKIESGELVAFLKREEAKKMAAHEDWY